MYSPGLPQNIFYFFLEIHSRAANSFTALGTNTFALYRRLVYGFPLCIHRCEFPWVLLMARTIWSAPQNLIQML